jgi:hypothetical protein
MLRGERPRATEETRDYRTEVPTSHEIFIGEPTALRGHAFAISGWPNWLIPTYQLRAARPPTPLLEEQR